VDRSNVHEGGEMPDTKQGNRNEKCSETPDFDVGDEVELLTWRIFGNKGRSQASTALFFDIPSMSEPTVDTPSGSSLMK
jgi:hypothetical protein